MAETEAAPLGGKGKVVEADETYVGGKEKNSHATSAHGTMAADGKEAVLTLVERGGRAVLPRRQRHGARRSRPMISAR